MVCLTFSLYILDVFTPQFLDDQFQLVFIDVDADARDDVNDVIRRRVLVASEHVKQVGCNAPHPWTVYFLHLSKQYMWNVISLFIRQIKALPVFS